jgi:hypothetical protein
LLTKARLVLLAICLYPRSDGAFLIRNVRIDLAIPKVDAIARKDQLSGAHAHGQTPFDSGNESFDSCRLACRQRLHRCQVYQLGGRPLSVHPTRREIVRQVRIDGHVLKLPAPRMPNQDQR